MYRNNNKMIRRVNIKSVKRTKLKHGLGWGYGVGAGVQVMVTTHLTIKWKVVTKDGSTDWLNVGH